MFSKDIQPLQGLHKSLNYTAFIHESNILSQFAHPNLPHLFGVTINEPPSIITSF